MNFAQSAIVALDPHVAPVISDDFLAVDLLDVLVEMVRTAEAALFAALGLAAAAAPAFGTVDDADTNPMECLLMAAEVKRAREGGFTSRIEALEGRFRLGRPAFVRGGRRVSTSFERWMEKQKARSDRDEKGTLNLKERIQYPRGQEGY